MSALCRGCIEPCRWIRTALMSEERWQKKSQFFVDSVSFFHLSGVLYSFNSWPTMLAVTPTMKHCEMKQKLRKKQTTDVYWENIDGVPYSLKVASSKKRQQLQVVKFIPFLMYLPLSVFLFIIKK